MAEVKTLDDSAKDRERPADATDRHGLDYLPHIDGLRGLAVALVVVFHAWPWVLQGGFVGVDIFFVISGYIITRRIAAEIEAGEFSFADFLSRRIRRLLPAAVVCIAATTALAARLMLPRELADYGRSVAAAGLMYANIHFYQSSGYFAPPANEMPLLHTWSLAVEDQFYLTWPLVLIGLFYAFKSRRRVAIAAALLALLSVVAAEVLARTDRDFAYYILLPRAFELLAGCAFAIWSPPAWRWSGAVALVSALAIGASAVLLNGASTFPGFLALPLVLGSLGLIWSGQTPGSLAARILSASLPNYCGRISYSLYLWHWPLLSLAHYKLERPLGGLEASAVVAAAVAVSAASLVWVERPFRYGPISRRPAWQVFSVAATCAVLLAALATVLVVGKGFPGRFNAEVQAFLKVSYTAKGYKRCDYNAAALADDSVCILGNPVSSAGGLDMAVFGDSNARHFGAMFDRLLQPRGLSGRTMAFPGCPPLIGVVRPVISVQTNADCTRYQRAILDFNLRNPALKLIVLSAIWASSYEGLVYNDMGPPGQAGKPVSFEDAVAWTITSLRKKGLKIWLIGTLPEIEVYSERCFVRDILDHSPVDHCGAQTRAVFDLQARARTLFSRLAQEDKGISYFNLAGLLCGLERCRTSVDGVFLYYDGAHLNDLGAAQLARYAPFPELK
jgi:peptidoglycan/LPS O-acetylase OafA/YrhL